MATKNYSQTNILVPARQFSRRTAIIVCLIVAAIGTYFILSSMAAPSGDFIKVATHPQAVAQPTEWGKTINALKSWNGKLYAGYGDYNANTGPIAINGFDGTNFASNLPAASLPLCAQSPATSEACTSHTETIDRFVEIAGKLYAPSIDPRGNNSNYVVGTPNGPGNAVWHNPPGFVEHGYDMATLTGTDLWIVGSKYGSNSGAAWRSVDGGNTWEESLTVAPAAPANCGYDNFTRFYGAGVLNGKLYIVATDYCSSVQRTKVFDGVSWSDGPSLPTFDTASNFAGKMVSIAYGRMQAFDGTSSQQVGPTAKNVGALFDYVVNGNTLYALYYGKVYKSTDLAIWTQIAVAPSSARSIAMHNNTLYVAGTDSGIYKHNGGTGGGSTGGGKPSR